jgi:sterol desaturase/sphingolipid hydroxylase (fatty acid hydroxylase superfamily)
VSSGLRVYVGIMSWLRKIPLELKVIPAYFATIELERRVLQRQQATPGARPVRGYRRRDADTSLRMGNLNSIVKLAMAPIEHRVSTAVWKRRLVEPRSKAAEIVIGMVVWDLAYYWWHRFNHRSRIAWAVHSQHHSSEYYNLTTALRQATPEVTGLAFYPLIGLLGVSPAVIKLSGSVNLLYQYWIHTEAIDRLPRWFERVFNTPSHHRVHHGSNPQYLDKNYGGILIVWDRLFGTFEPEVAPVTYGLTKNIGSYRLVDTVGSEFRAIAHDVAATPGLADKLGIVFMPPGWEPVPAHARTSAETSAGTSAETA